MKLVVADDVVLMRIPVRRTDDGIISTSMPRGVWFFRRWDFTGISNPEGDWGYIPSFS